MLNRSRNQKTIINSLLVAVLVSFVLFLAMFVNQMPRSEVGGDTIVRNVSAGPLDLLNIEKVPVLAGGYQINLKFMPGFLVYLLIFAVVGVGIGVLRTRHESNAESLDK